jgi:hypothetical protein
VLAYLIELAVVSLMDSPVSSVIPSAVAVPCLNHFLLEPIFSFGPASGQDALADPPRLVTDDAQRGCSPRPKSLFSNDGLPMDIGQRRFFRLVWSERRKSWRYWRPNWRYSAKAAR